MRARHSPAGISAESAVAGQADWSMEPLASMPAVGVAMERRRDLGAEEIGGTTVQFVPLFVVLTLSLLTASCALLRRTSQAEHVVEARQMSLQGLDAMQKGDISQAESCFAAAIHRNPADERAQRQYARLLWRRGLCEEAILHMEQSVRLSGGDPELRVELGEFYLARGDIDQAWREAERAIRAQPQLASAWALRADLLRTLDRTDEAMESYHRALSCQSHYPHVQMALADMYRAQNRPRRTLATIESLAQQYGFSQVPEDVLLRQGRALKEMGRLDDAVAVLSRATKRQDCSPELLYQLGEAQWLAGEPANAMLNLDAALSREPNHFASQRLREQILSEHRDLTAGRPSNAMSY